MSKKRKGIILAGGSGTRLLPLSKAISKQLMPIYDKPMIYYPLSILMLSGIREILIITTPQDLEIFTRLLGDGSKWGLTLKYKVQKKPNGLAEAFLIGDKFIDNSPCAMILGDNLFYGQNLSKQLQSINKNINGATIFAYQVQDPERYGVVKFDEYKNVINLIEKPRIKISNFAVTGLYFYDETVVDKVKELSPSSRGELEITDLNNLYLKEKKLKVEVFGRGVAWFDTGTFDSLQEAGAFIKTLENRQNLKVGCPEEIAWRMNWINNAQLENLAISLVNNNYGKYLLNLIKEYD